MQHYVFRSQTFYLTSRIKNSRRIRLGFLAPEFRSHFPGICPNSADGPKIPAESARIRQNLVRKSSENSIRIWFLLLIRDVTFFHQLTFRFNLQVVNRLAGRLHWHLALTLVCFVVISDKTTVTEE